MKKVPVYGISDFYQESHDLSFYANGLPIHLEEHRFVNFHHRHSTYVTVLFTKGTGEHVIDFDSYPVKRGQLFFLTPGQVHCWSLSDDVDGFVFFHTKEFYENQFASHSLSDFPFFKFGPSSPLLQIEEPDMARMEAIFKEIVHENTKETIYRNLKINALLSILYADLSLGYHERSSRPLLPSGTKKTQELLALIETYFIKKKSAHEYADLLHMSTRHLSRICLDTLHISTTELIQNRIVLEARRLLAHQNASVQSVAEELGYDDYAYFIRLFKKKTGMSPKEFQLSLRTRFSFQ